MSDCCWPDLGRTSDSLGTPRARGTIGCWQLTSLHAKTFVVDERWSSVGTMNFDNRSLVLNDEVTLMVLDDGFGQRMATMFRNDLERAVEITPDAFARRPWTERVLEEGANLIARVL